MLTPSLNWTKSSKNWESWNRSNWEWWVSLSEMETCWCTLGRLRDFLDTWWPSTLEAPLSPFPMHQGFPRKPKWSSIPTRRSTLPSMCPLIHTNWVHIMPLYLKLYEELFNNLKNRRINVLLYLIYMYEVDNRQ